MTLNICNSSQWPHIWNSDIENLASVHLTKEQRAQWSLLSNLWLSDPNVCDMWQSVSYIVKDIETSERKDELFNARWCYKWVAIGGKKLSWTHTSHQNKFQMDGRLKTKKWNLKPLVLRHSASNVHFRFNYIHTQEGYIYSGYHAPHTESSGLCVAIQHWATMWGSILTISMDQSIRAPDDRTSTVLCKNNSFKAEDHYTPIFIMTIIKKFAILTRIILFLFSS